MSIHKKNTRDIWIDDLLFKSETMLKYLNKKTDLSTKEQQLADLCAGFIYLKTLCEKEDYFEEPDNEMFETVTIH
jgi:hypothetical protein|tara:strand:- start:753 stop:977 length:225 start_codon:yes stop_codon:yes gene_type:complete